MRCFTLITEKNPTALAQVVDLLSKCATGVTFFTRPEFVTAPVNPDQATVAQLTTQMEEAAASKNYRRATACQEQIDQIRANAQDEAKKGAQWIIDIAQPIKEITQLVVLTNLNWPMEKVFNAANFFSDMERISGLLCGGGISGIKQLTPLRDRAFIPFPSSGPNGMQGEPAAGSTLGPLETGAQRTGPPPQNLQGVREIPAAPSRHPMIPKNLDEKQAKYAEFRLGLDRGGQRRNVNETGNMLGYSPYLARKMETSINDIWAEFQATIVT
jgi:hypothetical protein